MTRKAICLLILSSMALHCAGRLGLLDYLYAKRSSIAYSLGLTAEKVIASCGLGHYQEESLAIADEGDHPGNPISSQALEINVFFQPSSVSMPIDLPVSIVTQFSANSEGVPFGISRSLFHPPSLKG